MVTTPLAELGALPARQRWHQVSAEAGAPALHVGLLASYTIDPVVPWLGLGLHEAGLPARVTVGPFDQIVQQCLDDDGAMARARPDVLVVAPRFEELGPLSGPGGDRGARGDGDVGGGPADHADELLRVADAAASAAGRWGAWLVYVLPAVPEARPYGVADTGRPGGAVALATAAREAVRAELAGRPGVCLVDAEEAVRRAGTARAHRPSMFRFAKVPYASEVFAALGAQLAAALAVRFGRGCRAVVVDADSLVLGHEGGAEALRAPLSELRAAGVRLALRAGGDVDGLGSRVVGAMPDLAGALLSRCAVDGRPAADQVRSLCAGLGVPVESAVVLTAGAGAGGGDAAARTVVLGDTPEAWPAELLAAGVFDRLPPVRERTRPAAVAARPADRAGGRSPGESLREFVAGLQVRVACDDLDRETPALVELVERAKDFTLGRPFPPPGPAAGAGRRVLAVRVADRFGDHGTSGAVALRRDGEQVVVEVFSLSCPVLGKGVEDAVMGQIVERAAAAGATTVRFRLRETAHNRVAAAFLAGAAGRAWVSGSGREVAVAVSVERDERS